ncbi:MAG: arginase family protein [Alphaproteobacteria bacterium]|nr:arginase family protein [Alphaproteobacteria bacterium]
MATKKPAPPEFAWDEDLTAGVQTFMGVPYSRDLSKSKAAILGIPFDCGLHPVRLGARTGPAAIREQSTLVRPYQPPIADYNPLKELNVVDCGNVRVVLGDTSETFRRIEAAVSHIVDAGCTPITFGGDGSVSLPQVRALHRKYPDLCLLHFDAHTDTYPDVAGQQIPGTNIVEFNPATTFTRAAEEGVLDVKNSLHIGARGTISVQGVFDFTRKQGYELVTGVDLMEMGIKKMVDYIHDRLRGKPVYLCWDMDFFDPSCAPGVFTPTWGGVSAREGLQLLQGLSGLDIVATDVNTLSPLHDVGGMSAFLAGTCVMECIFLAAAAERARAGR